MEIRDKTQQRFHLLLIKPSHYDDEGYVIQWLRSSLPSNSLAAVYGIARDAAQRKVLGEDVEIRIRALDETNSRVRVGRLVREIRRGGGKALVGMIGVQSNQYPRALDIARQFRAADLSVVIGGFHVSGCLAMLEEMPVELHEALGLGISLFAGELEGRLDDLLRDAARGVGVDLLAQAAHAGPARRQQTAGVGCFVAREQAQEGALARAICAHETDPIACTHVDRHALEQRAASNLPRDILGP